MSCNHLGAIMAELVTSSRWTDDMKSRTVRVGTIQHSVGISVEDLSIGGMTKSSYGVFIEPHQAQTIAALMRPDAVRELLDYLTELDHQDERFRADLELAVSEYLSL